VASWLREIIYKYFLTFTRNVYTNRRNTAKDNYYAKAQCNRDLVSTDLNTKQ